ncbi:ferric reductase-like transmembrane domain-containing protein [Actinoplanes sp. LDG1-06]|uniref:Ferric reductase-like transmembrane domain-containing protein n=1 Tax=Paractinoplanes ovalisporus TaxID=2810368 RepID=A0ABS2AIA1_9ACTN|nr:ferredoxin reductase family protein [Actinoplanes ovalisporus]MBM2619569.1 ferric reductase-like transmembrane domain-containing protein [Actinoplanes ovalisporus]
MTIMTERRTRPDAAAVLAGGTLLVVTALWVSNGGLQDLTGGGALSATGRLLGLWASNLLLIQVLLMARIPLVERAFGQDRLARWHRWTGFSSFWLMVAHIVLITLGYAATARTNPLQQLWQMIWNFPGMLLAAAGFLALCMVVVTSIRAARRRLRYESWHLLHLYAYLGAFLALPHQLWSGSDFVGSPWATAYWWGLWGAAVAAVIAYRLIVPLLRNRRHRLVVDRVVPEANGITSVYFNGNNLNKLPVRAGQFFHWRFLDGPGWTRANPFSLSAAPAGQIRITVKDSGDGSARVATLKRGTRVLVEGPFGKLTGENYTGGPVVLLACGIGITPLLALLGELPYGPGEATLLYRVRDEASTAFRHELDRFAAERGVRVVYLTGPRARSRSWLPAGRTDELTALAPDIRAARVFICGPEAWATEAQAAVRAAGVPASRVHTELFSW